MAKIFDAIPKFFIGPLVVILGIFYFLQADPPRTVCDTQFEIFKKANEKYIFGYKAKRVTVPPGITNDIERCQAANSPGGCFDMLEGIRKTLPSSRHIPLGCESRINDLKPYPQQLEQIIFTFSQISWNNTQIVRAGFFNWLEYDEMILFCRIKREYTRLVGEEAYKKLEQKLLKELVKLRKLSEKQTWERTILSYQCPLLNT